ncbi:LOW QUALITY PROTEIN: probable mannitol dehydrogenase [Phalaenopsis equestris]|uniref:LOW QUALITY PROTEIN: probable mannitol dehydrogenase n=1 Tax=Phalaenopsis equestris TaxID=78828 RepID=UPI0009E4EB69|nr:LOW QUALITY PROTEIN: probable mannitol dehydrogenase [Phalaenopsis equestris]
MAATTQNGGKVATTEEDRRKVFGLAARDSSGVLSPFHFYNRKNGEDDVTIKILYCGICHSDLHQVKNEWKNTVYPSLPGHEIVGLVTEVGNNVGKFKIGDKVGVGCLVGSCHSCENCIQNQENYCSKLILTYNSIDTDGTITYGGYSDKIVVNQHFVVKLPENLAMDKVAPLLCAGITVYNSMKSLGLNEAGKHLGVVGLGGLGHIAVKFGKAFGMKVTVISSSMKKREEAIKQLGADDFLISSDPQHMQGAIGTMDGIINTVSAKHNLVPLIALLKTKGKLAMVGAPEHPLELHVAPLLFGGKTITGSLIGGMKDTQEMIDFAGEHNITAEIELIGADYVTNEAMKRLAKADVRYRFVIDIGNTLYSVEQLG